MTARDRRNVSVLASASLIRWVGRRLWRSFFLVMFALAVGVLVLTLTSRPVFTRASALMAQLWPEAPLVSDALARDLAAEREARASAEAGAEALARRLAETEAALAESEALRAAAEAQAEQRLAGLAAATRRWLDLERELARREAEARAAAEAATAAAPVADEDPAPEAP